MKNIIRFIKKLFGHYDTGYEYWVNIDEVAIKPYFLYSKIGNKKFRRKWKFYWEHGYCESEIILNKNFVLVDGYSSYKIYKTAQGCNSKVPVYFVD